jgi:hypothetical protein
VRGGEGSAQPRRRRNGTEKPALRESSDEVDVREPRDLSVREGERANLVRGDIDVVHRPLSRAHPGQSVLTEHAHRRERLVHADLPAPTLPLEHAQCSRLVRVRLPPVETEGYAEPDEDTANRTKKG